ncbi:Vi polysaccharide biosynthesis UDP-N-acetylglucosamine C-6 dehydrogenase TviB, partial [Acinetobacter baumannii]
LYDAIVIAVAHNQFKSMSAHEFHALGKEKHVLYDLKYVLTQNESSIRL